MVQRGYWSSKNVLFASWARENGAKISRGTNVLFFRDVRTIGRRKLVGILIPVKRELQAGLCSEGIPACFGQVSGSP